MARIWLSRLRLIDTKIGILHYNVCVHVEATRSVPPGGSRSRHTVPPESVRTQSSQLYILVSL